MDHKEVRVIEPQRQKKSYATEGKFRTIEPKILHFGTPVALLSSLNEDVSTDLAPISSFWAPGMDFASRIVHRDQNRTQRGAAPGMRSEFAKSRNVA